MGGDSRNVSMGRRFLIVPTSQHDTQMGLQAILSLPEYYEKEDAEECIMYAELILERVKEFIGK